MLSTATDVYLEILTRHFVFIHTFLFSAKQTQDGGCLRKWYQPKLRSFCVAFVHRVKLRWTYNSCVTVEVRLYSETVN